MALAVVKTLEDRVISAVDSIKDRHTAQVMDILGAEVPGCMRAHVRASSLQLRRIEDALGHLQRYKEAQQVSATPEGVFISVFVGNGRRLTSFCP